jgi:hypothetical protein
LAYFGREELRETSVDRAFQISLLKTNFSPTTGSE